MPEVWSSRLSHFFALPASYHRGGPAPTHALTPSEAKPSLPPRTDLQVKPAPSIVHSGSLWPLTLEANRASDEGLLYPERVEAKAYSPKVILAGESPQHSRARWSEPLMPLAVYFTPKAPWQDSLLKACLLEWSGASLGQVRFQPPAPWPDTFSRPLPESPGIFFQWRPEPPGALPFQVGLTQNLFTPQGQLHQAIITLIDQPAIDQQLSPEAQQLRFRATLLHELGHALGLEHSSQAEQVMYFRGWRNAYLSEGDALAIQQLYEA